MKPIKLVMNAFGPYASREEVSFEKFGEGGIFLITGKTGAGKTTIFDGITYALFNKTSGMDRGINTLRSDYASEKEETYVEFTFSHMGNIYEIYRSPQYERPKKNGTGFTKKTAKARMLREPDTPIEGTNQVTEAVVDLLKIDYNQFKQISMIAQGEFREVLNADPQKRRVILQKIFSTEGYEKMGNLMELRYKKAYGDMADIFKSIDQYFDGIQYDAVSKYAHMIEEQKKMINAERSQYQVEKKTELLQSIIEEDTEKIDQQEADYKEKKKLAEEKAAAYTLIHSVNELFNKYDKIISEKNILDAQKEEMEKTSERIVKQKKAVYEVKPLQDAFDSERRTLETAVKKQGKAKEDYQKSVKISQKAEEDLNRAEAKRILADEKKQKAELLKIEEEKYAQRDDLKKQIVDHEGKKQQYIDQKIQAEGLLDALRKKIETAQARIRALSDRPELCASVNAECERLKEKHQSLEKLTKKINLDLYKLESALSEAQKEYNEKRNIYDTARTTFDHYEKLLEESRAGILASHLEEGEPCPVCGSTVHPFPAHLSGKNVSENELKVLKEKRDHAESEKNAANNKAVAAKTAFETEKKNIQEEILFQLEMKKETVSEWKILIQNLEDFFAEIKQQKKDREEYLVRLLKEKKELEDLQKVASQDLEKQEKLRDDLEENKNLLNLLETNLADLSGQLKGIQDLKYKNLKEAKAVRMQLEHESDQIYQEIKEKQKALAAAKEAVSADRATLESADQQAKRLKTSVSEKEQAYIAARTSQGFEDEKEYQSYVVLKSKISELEQYINDYQKRVTANEASLSLAEKDIAGKERKDESMAETEMCESKQAESMAQELLTKLKHRKQQNADILKKIEDKQKKVEKKLEEVGMFHNLTELLKGRANKKNKTSFETYVQLSGFDAIIHAANKRLLPISGGQYQLFRHEDREAKGNVALNLDILDNYTGKLRPVNTLSGGESFMASLSLALGLSDHVTASAGGIKIDALFIDEGFGTLDENSLNDAIGMLQELSTSNKLIGIISHREELKEVIPKKIAIKKTKNGSRVDIDLGV